jgi:hypothetical protein
MRRSGGTSRTFRFADIEASEQARVIDLVQHRTAPAGKATSSTIVSSGEDALEKAVLAPSAPTFADSRSP